MDEDRPNSGLYRIVICSTKHVLDNCFGSNESSMHFLLFLVCPKKLIFKQKET